MEEMIKKMIDGLVKGFEKLPVVGQFFRYLDKKPTIHVLVLLITFLLVSKVASYVVWVIFLVIAGRFLYKNIDWR